jgi:glycosyltransferase involved in cell wall biosynthesis
MISVPSRPRLLIVGPLPPPYTGPAVATKRLLTSKVMRGRFDLLFLNIADADGADSIGRLTWHNIGLAICHGLRCLSLIHRERPSAVYIPIDRAFWGFLRDLLIIFAGRLYRTAIIAHLRAGRFDLIHDYGAVGRMIARIGLRFISCALVLGEPLRNIFGDYLPPEKIRVAANGIDLTGWSGNSGSSISQQATTGPIHIVYLANLFRDKGAHIMLAALAHVVERIPDVRVSFAGTWMDLEFRSYCMNLVSKHKLENHVEFLGMVDEERKRELLSRAHMLVFVPVKAEGFPWVILEGMASGLPVIATPQGMIKDVVIDGETGYLIPPDDPEGLAEHIVRLGLDAKLRVEMGLRGRERIATGFSATAAHEKLAKAILDHI